MIYTKSTFLAFFCLLIGVTTYAKDSTITKIPRSYVLFLSSGLSNIKSFDNSLSPNVYSGYGVALNAGYEAGRLNKTGGFSLSAGYGGTHYSASARPLRSELNFEFEGWKMWKISSFNSRINQKKKTDIFLGPDLKLASNFRIPSTGENNFFSYDIATSLGITGSGVASVRFFKRDWIIKNRLTLPLLTYLIRPGFTGPYPSNFVKDGIFKTTGYVNAYTAIESGNIVTIDKYFNLNNKLSLSYPFIKNNNMLRFTYEWNFYRSSIHYKKALYGSHIFFITFLIKM